MGGTIPVPLLEKNIQAVLKYIFNCNSQKEIHFVLQPNMNTKKHQKQVSQNCVSWYQAYPLVFFSLFSVLGGVILVLFF